MPRMQITKVVHDSGKSGVILGPCPGCEMWTVQYDRDVEMSFGSAAAFAEVIEEILADHLDECRGLQEIIFEKI